MKKMSVCMALGGAALLFAGCETPLPPGAEKGPDGTMAYIVAVDASAPGARIEANGQSLGNTPLQLKIFGDRDGTFHDFGSYYYVIHAFPLASNQFPQTRIFWTGRNGTHEDRVPDKVYFDMSQSTPVYAPTTGPGGPPPPPDYYYGPPYPYPPWGYYPGPYWGPAFRVYVGPGYHHWHR